MFKKTLTACASVAALALVAAAPASATLPHWLDTREAPAPGVAGDTGTFLPLYKNYFYIAKVEGNFSYVKQDLWTGTSPGVAVCGTPTPIKYRSPGQPAGVGGTDAETVFAGVASIGCGNFVPPVHWNNFQISLDNGSTYSHVEPIGGHITSPSAGNEYGYLLKGKSAKAKFRLLDGTPSDNNGKLLVRVRPLLPSDCSGTGWSKLGAFTSASACTKAVFKGAKADEAI